MSENNVKTCQRRSQITIMTEEKTKEIVLETLIELGLIPKPERKKEVDI